MPSTRSGPGWTSFAPRRSIERVPSRKTPDPTQKTFLKYALPQSRVPRTSSKPAACSRCRKSTTASCSGRRIYSISRRRWTGIVGADPLPGEPRYAAALLVERRTGDVIRTIIGSRTRETATPYASSYASRLIRQASSQHRRPLAPNQPRISLLELLLRSSRPFIKSVELSRRKLRRRNHVAAAAVAHHRLARARALVTVTSGTAAAPWYTRNRHGRSPLAFSD